MSAQKNLDKGAEMEENLRTYFNQAGYFVVRGVPVYQQNELLTDIDLWLYGQTTGEGRVIRICDIKNKSKPKSIERLIWVKGLTNLLGVESAFLATTDVRPVLQELAKKLNIQLVDGKFINQILSDSAISSYDRIDDETFFESIRDFDTDSQNRFLSESHGKLLSILPEKFGISSAINASILLRIFASNAIKEVPNSPRALVLVRLSFLAASIFFVSLDYFCSNAIFCTPIDRKNNLIQALRFGALGGEDEINPISQSISLIEKHSPNTPVGSIMDSIMDDLHKIPVEIITEPIVKSFENNELFNTCLEFEKTAYQKKLPAVESLTPPTKTLLSALFEHLSVQFTEFKNCWKQQAY